MKSCWHIPLEDATGVEVVTQVTVFGTRLMFDAPWGKFTGTLDDGSITWDTEPPDELSTTDIILSYLRKG